MAAPHLLLSPGRCLRGFPAAAPPSTPALLAGSRWTAQHAAHHPHSGCQHAALAQHTQHRRTSSFAAATAAAVAAGSNGSSDAAPAAARTAEAGRPLDATIGPGLQLMEQAYRVSGRVLRLVAPMDVDAVLDAYIAAGLDRDPYWCRTWPSAICLAQQLLRRPELVAGKRVADFGSGLGVAGLAAALAGAREVVLLDREPMALCCGLLSAAATGIVGVAGLEALQQQAHADLRRQGAAQEGDSEAQQPLPPAALLQLAQLYAQRREQGQFLASPPSGGGDGPALQQQQQQQQHQPAAGSAASGPQQQLASCIYRALPFDWSSSAVTERYDVVLACDVLYEAEAVHLVAGVIPKLLRPGSGGSLLLADPPNRTAANRQRFLQLISSAQPTRLLLQESGLERCDVQQLDPEMLDGVTSESVQVQFMVFQAGVGNDTVGLKAL